MPMVDSNDVRGVSPTTVTGTLPSSVPNGFRTGENAEVGDRFASFVSDGDRILRNGASDGDLPSGGE